MAHCDHALGQARWSLHAPGAVIVGGGRSAAEYRSRAGAFRRHGSCGGRAGHLAAFAGEFELRLLNSEHYPPDRVPWRITEPVGASAKAAACRCGEAWSILVHHRSSDRRLLIQGSAAPFPGALVHGIRAEVAYLGVGQLGLQSPDYIEQSLE